MKEPALTGGDLAAGQTAEGWMTFQLPIELTSITVTYSDGIFGDEHEWVVGYDPAAGPVIAATPMPASTAGPTSTPEPTTKPSPRRGLGYTYADPNIRVTLERVEWNTGDTFFKPDEGKQWVSVLVRYVARQPADFDSGQDWAVVDNDGFDGEQQFFTPKDPQLTDGRLRKGSSVRGWITYEFAKGVTSIEVTYTDGLGGDEHKWVVKRPKG